MSDLSLPSVLEHTALNCPPGHAPLPGPAVKSLALTNPRNHFRLAGLFSILAGLTDTATGLLLVTNPFFTLQLMGIGDVSPTQFLSEGVLLRFIGVFVGAIGLAYLYPWLLGWRNVRSLTRSGRRPDASLLLRLKIVFEVTCLVRLLVALFVGASAINGSLSAPWLLISATDLSYALFQAAALRRGWLNPAPVVQGIIGIKATE